jgi:hypothetical protein
VQNSLKSFKKGNLCEEKVELVWSRHVLQCGVKKFPESGLLLNTYRKEKHSEMRDKTEGMERVDVSILLFIFQNQILKSKYLDNCLFKLRTVFIFKFPASRSLKLNPMLIGLKLLFILAELLQLYF